MRHGKKINKLSRKASHRKALLENLAASLFLHGYIETTVAKAKALRPYAEKLVTKAIRARREDSFANRLHIIRTIASEIRAKPAFRSLLMVWAVICMNRPGGYTRIIKKGKRKGDGAEMAFISIVIDQKLGERYVGNAAVNIAFRELSEKLLRDFLPTYELLQSWSICEMPEIKVSASLAENDSMIEFGLSFENISQEHLENWPIVRGAYANLPLTIEIDCRAKNQLGYFFETSNDITIIPSFTKESLFKVHYSPLATDVQSIAGKIESKPQTNEIVIEKSRKTRRRGGKANRVNDNISNSGKIIKEALDLEFCDLIIYGPLGRIYHGSLMQDIIK